MNFSVNMPKEVEHILDVLCKNNNTAVVVGGCVRDSIMGQIPKDWDIATSATPDKVQELFKDYNMILDGLKHGTVTIIINHVPYEITTFRTDGKYTDFRRPDSVEFVTDLEEDVKRRDLTINSIAYDGKNIIDLCGGIDDIKHGIIRCVGNADDRFQEDPLRILRAIRFAARYGFKIDQQTKESMFRNAHLLERIAIERKQKEFTMAIDSRFTYILEDYAQILSYVMPNLQYNKDFRKTLCEVMNCDRLEEKLAILLDSIDVREYNIIIKWLSTIMKYPNKCVKSVCNILEGRNQLMAGTEINIRWLLSKYPEEDVISIISFKIAKINAVVTDKQSISDVDYLTRSIRRVRFYVEHPDTYCYNKKHLAVNGHDLKSAGVADLDMKEMFDKLLYLVITNQVTNDKESLMCALKICML